MTPTKSIRIALPQTFDEPDDNERNERRQSQSSGQGGSGIPVFRSFSISDIWNRNEGAEDENANKRRARIPSIVPPSGELYYATPLPGLSIVVLSIAMLTEFLSASVAGPFMLFMVKGFGGFAEDSEIAFWTGILVAMFFLTQFLTSLLWASLAEKYSPRVVLIICLLGSALSTIAFGASDSLAVAIICRLAQGAFAGSIGVTKSSIGAVTDSTNEGRAYAILGFCWGFGSVIGAVIGGTFERPAVKWPSVFGTVPFFVDFPYILPCIMASSIMIIGFFLAWFLGPDLGPRAGREYLNQENAIVPLPSEAEGENNPGSMRSYKRLSRKLSGALSNHFVADSEERTPLLFAPFSPPTPTTSAAQDSISTTPVDRVANYSSIAGRGYPLDRNQTMTMDSARSLTKRRFSSTGQRPARGANVSGILRRGSNAGINNRVSRISNVDVEGSEGYRRARPISGAGKRLSLIDRVVLANENAHMNGIADFWVASAISLEGSNAMDDLDDEERDVGSDNDGEDDEDRVPGESRIVFSHRHSISNQAQRPSRLSNRPVMGGAPVVPRNFTPISPLSARPNSPVQARVPHSDSERFLPRTETIESTLSDVRIEPVLKPIIESKRVSNFYPPASDENVEEDEIEKGVEVSSEGIPVLIILQYGLLALHATTHDQVFVSYMVTPYEAGGLNLNAGDIARLTAMMSAFQIFYQFYLYPNVGPPRGPLSYLTLFRLGCLLYIPSYLSVIFYRSAFASPGGSGNSVLMFALAASTAIRQCGSTFGYTSISILLNYMTPPLSLRYANGVAQSTVSLARCIGPIVGGWLWSYSTQDDPSGYYLGFVLCAVFCVVSVAHSFVIR
ncbi:MFS general substrate transporter [Marasmius fiardii PR-910]|nr:MFS general substrate transporter [Marasmius fiardii PR-910]